LAGSITETYLSRSFTAGSGAGRELTYTVTGTSDEGEVLTLIGGEAPATYRGLVLQSISAQPDGTDSIWQGKATYRTLETEYSFDTTGGTVKLTQSFGTVHSYAPAGLIAPDFRGAINVTDDKVEGVDVPSFAFQFSITKQMAAATVTVAYQKNLALLGSGTFNNASFKGWDAGEVSFLGATGSQRDDDYVTLTYKFACQPNATGLTVGDITGVDKLGWDYLWVRYGTYADPTAKCLVQRPIACYVERVLTPSDYSLLLIGV
jgi:hypothetical protein